MTTLLHLPAAGSQLLPVAWRLAGAIAVAAGVPLNVWADQPFKRAGTPAQERGYRLAMRRRFIEAVGRHKIATNKAHLICGNPAIELSVLAATAFNAILVVNHGIESNGPDHEVASAIQCERKVDRHGFLK